MEPPPADATRPTTPTECRKEALLRFTFCLVSLAPLSNSTHLTFLPHWAVLLMCLAGGLYWAHSGMHWLLFSRYLGQTVTWRFGPRGHTWWQRIVTYPAPQVSDNAQNQLSESTIVTLGLTLATGIVLLFMVGAFTQTPKANIWLGLFYFVTDVALFIYTIHNWKQVWQQRRRRAHSQPANTNP